jgi:translation initiation factor 3 subunit F
MSLSSLPDIQSNPALLMQDAPTLIAGTNNSTTSATPAGTARVVLVHPLAIVQVLDHHGRRHHDNVGSTSENGGTSSMNDQSRVIGTLLGRIDGNVIEITNCFAVPHAERGDEVAIGKDFNRKMLALHMRSSKDIVVGWYASAAGESLVADTSSLIHEFYAGECEDNDPVHLVVDTRLINDCLQIKAYQSSPLIVQGDHVGNIFHELQICMHSNEAETICLREMIKSSSISNGTEKATDAPSAEGLQVSLEKLYQLLDSTLAYVNSVVDGTIPMNPEKGRQISDTLAAIPRVRPEIFDKLFHNALQDLLMVTYLSNLTRTQMEIAEKLNATLGSS